MFQLKNINKAYGNHYALKNINLTIHSGEIHGLAGVNGSGKSTLLNILSGQPTIQETGGFSGEIIFKEQPPVESQVKAQAPANKSKTVNQKEIFLNLSSPKEANSMGIGMVHQEFALFSTLTVSENITLTREKVIPFTQKLFGKNLACIDEKANNQTASTILESIGIAISEDMVTGNLSVSTRQFVEIAREMSREDLTLLLLDEPTAVLNKSESDRLMGAVRKIADRGVAILYVSHRIEELISLCDKITVLRGGEVIETVSREDFKKDIKEDINKNAVNYDAALKKISRLMVGSSVVKIRRKSENNNISLLNNKNEAAVNTSDFTVDKSGDNLKSLNLTIYKGEIFGITGLSGHGRNALGVGLMGLNPTSGICKIYGKDIEDIRKNRSEDIRRLIWLVPEERRTLGLLMDHSIMDNITFPAIQNKNMFINYNGFSRFIPDFLKFPNRAFCCKHAQKFVDELDIKCSSIHQKVGELSGGNQQKVCIAAALTMQPDILFISEPTRGIDIAGKEAILNLLVKAHENLGMTIIISSGELEELKRICDRIAVLYEGRLFDVFTPDTSDEEFALAFSGLR
ncbi:MAG: sugar ABC transporter ATP-binding protein [Desulfamplus sp.]|nr:sugar ABC transporter ATP-binding protein [Desulfamplus sp.]